MFRQDEIAQENGQSATVGIKQWLVLDLVSLLNIIPIIGSIAALIIYIIIAVRNDTAPSMKSRIIINHCRKTPSFNYGDIRHLYSL